ncbi:hypothetical protein LXL04_011400 [Taraxacum kok-saghyz]
MEDDLTNELLLLSTPNRPPNDNPRFNSTSSSGSDPLGSPKLVLFTINLCNKSLENLFFVCRDKFSISFFVLSAIIDTKQIQLLQNLFINIKFNYSMIRFEETWMEKGCYDPHLVHYSTDFELEILKLLYTADSQVNEMIQLEIVKEAIAGNSGRQEILDWVYVHQGTTPSLGEHRKGSKEGGLAGVQTSTYLYIKGLCPPRNHPKSRGLRPPRNHPKSRTKSMGLRPPRNHPKSRTKSMVIVIHMAISYYTWV